MGWRGYADKHLFEILDVAQSLGMVLCFHPSKDRADMEQLFANFKKMPIVVAHLDGYGLYDFAIEMMQKYDNVYADISAHGAEREGMLEDAVRRVGADRILYGSDYPGYSPKPFIDRILAAKLTDGEREAILYGNAARLLGIS
jgi:predicted TIM-barrel fold metal-dependent hydrolase